MPLLRYLFQDTLKRSAVISLMVIGAYFKLQAQNLPNLAILNRGNQTMDLIYATDNTTLYNTPSVVAIGSSTFYGVGASVPSQTSAVALISAWLKSNAAGGSVIQNLAVPGYSSNDLIPGNGNTSNNVEKAASLNPSFVILSLPTNDATLNTTTQWLNNLILIDNYLKARGIVLLVEGTQPRNTLTASQDQELSDMNTIIGNYFGSRFVNVLNLLRDPTNASPAVYNPIYNSGDGIHPNDLGHQIIANQFISVMKSYFIPNTNSSWDFQVSSNGTVFTELGSQPVSSLKLNLPLDARFFKVRAVNANGSFGPFTNIAQYLGYVSTTPIPPTANAGGWNFINLPAQAVFNASASQSASGPLIYLWTKVSGPTGDIILTKDSMITKVSFTQPGNYTYQILVKDKNGLTATATSNAVVTGTTLVPPFVNGGAWNFISLPSLAILNSSASRANSGTLVKYHWSKVSGPAGDIILKPDSVITQVSYTQAGTYVYQITVTDNNGLSSSSTTDVIVTGTLSSTPPFANAGGWSFISLPAQSVLNASASHGNGAKIVKYHWSKLSGPTGDIILSPDSIITKVSFTQAGTYVYQITVTDSNGLTASATVQANVSPAAGGPPIANGGAWNFITLPSLAVLNASASKASSGTLVKFHWSKVSGPTGDILLKPDSIITSVSFTQAGTYVYQILVTDNSGLTATSTVDVIVSSPPTSTTAFNPFGKGFGFAGVNYNNPFLDSTLIRENTGFNAQSLRLYPNPVLNVSSLAFTGNAPGNSSLEVLDLSGKSYGKWVLPNLSSELAKDLDFSSLRPGVYLLHISWSGGQNKTIRFIKN